MEVVILLVIAILSAITVIMFCIMCMSLKSISESLEIISYTIKNNGVNLETQHDIEKVAKEVVRNKDRIKKLEVSEELTKHKVENLSREVTSYRPVSRNKNLH